MNILLFDIFITGHHTEYIGHLVKYIHNNENIHKYFFVVHPLLIESSSERKKKSFANNNIVWINISNDEFNKCNRGGLLNQSITSYRIMNQYALKYNIDHVVLLSFNSFQLSLSVFRSSYTISGILFNQFYRISKSENIVKYLRKYLQTLFFTYNKKITNVFVLNDILTVQYLNKEFQTSIFKYLPDPIPELNSMLGFDIYKEYNISRGRTIFLHIGSLGERKGTFEILDSLGLLSSDIRNRIFILLVGKVDRVTSEKIYKKFNDLNLSPFCYLDNSFVTTKKMKSLFQQCHVVLIPYKNPEASSGILGHAAASYKPVIGPSTGLLGELINFYNLGFTIKKCTPIFISEAIKSSLDFPFSIKHKNINFIKEHNSVNFSQIILDIKS